jgi:hypothetical protein
MGGAIRHCFLSKPAANWPCFFRGRVIFLSSLATAGRIGAGQVRELRADQEA